MLRVKTADTGYAIDIVGGSKDISFGQVLDRTGVELGMMFPAGEEMDRIAMNTLEPSSVLTPIKSADGWINLSGIETQLRRTLTDMDVRDAGHIIRELFTRITEAMADMTIQCAKKTGISDVIMAGGVTSSRFIRAAIEPLLSAEGDKC